MVFFTGDGDFTRKHYLAAKRANCSIVDLSFALEDQPGFPVRAPWLEEELGYKPTLDNAGAVVAHPAATLLAFLLLKAAIWPRYARPPPPCCSRYRNPATPEWTNCISRPSTC